MKGNVLRRVRQGIGANAYGQLVTIIVQLAGVPILLYSWGTQLYGEWLLLFAIPAYLSISDLGFSQSAGNDMTARVARGDRNGALVVFQSLTGLVYVIGALGLIFSGALLYWLPMQNWLHFQSMNIEAVRWTLWLLTAEVFAGLLLGVTHAAYRAAGDYAFDVVINSTIRFIQFAAVWGAALAGGGPVTAAALFLCVRAFAIPILIVILTLRHKWLKFSLASMRNGEFRKLLRPALANLALPFGQILNVQGMVIMIGSVIGPSAVVVFSTLRTLSRLVLQLVSAIGYAAEPEFAAAYGSNNRSMIRSLFRYVLHVQLWIAIVFGGGLGVFGAFILEIWTHGKVAMHPALYAWLLGSAVASVLWRAGLIFLKAANLHLRVAIAYVLGSAATLAAAWWLLKMTSNLASAGFALLITDAVMALITLKAVSSILMLMPSRVSNDGESVSIKRVG